MEKLCDLFRASIQTASAPLLSFLHRFSEVPLVASKFQDQKTPEPQPSCTALFLDMLELPADERVEIDFKQAAVYIMSRLDRLASPHMPPLSFNKVSVENDALVRRK